MKTSIRTNGSYEWWTPPEIVEELGPFDLDPCAGFPFPWITANEMHHELGLMREWYGRVWLNPPYGNETGKWLSMMANHNNGIALVMSRTGAPWFFDHIWGKASGLYFLRHRIHFYSPEGVRACHNCGDDCVLVAYGSDNAKRLKNFSLEGYFV